MPVFLDWQQIHIARATMHDARDRIAQGAWNASKGSDRKASGCNEETAWTGAPFSTSPQSRFFCTDWWPVALDDKARAAIREGSVQARRGEFVPEEEIEALWKRHGL
jgi:hypothetical protein